MKTTLNFFETYLPELIVSRETISNYEIYYNLLNQWNKAISLVQEKTLDEFLVRHIIDSLQVVNFIENLDSNIVDIGTGAGFPGLVLAIYGYSNIQLVESNLKKTIFLSEVARKTKISVKIVNQRAENLKKKL